VKIRRQSGGGWAVASSRVKRRYLQILSPPCPAPRAEAGALRIPRVLAVSGGAAGAAGDGATASLPAFLVLELIEPARSRRDFDEQLGRGLAALHRTGAPGFGLDHDNFIGPLPQGNRPLDAAPEDWAAFLRARRLEPQLRRAVDGRRASSAMRAGFDRLFAAVSWSVRPSLPPACTAIYGGETCWWTTRARPA